MAVISATTSDTTTVPSGPTSGAAASPSPPGPQASSSTRSPGRSAAAASSSCVTASPRVVDVVGVVLPGRRDRGPHAVQATAVLVVGRARRGGAAWPRRCSADVGGLGGLEAHGSAPVMRTFQMLVTSNEYCATIPEWPSLSSPSGRTTRRGARSRPPPPAPRSSVPRSDGSRPRATPPPRWRPSRPRPAWPSRPSTSRSRPRAACCGRCGTCSSRATRTTRPWRRGSGTSRSWPSPTPHASCG